MHPTKLATATRPCSDRDDRFPASGVRRARAQGEPGAEALPANSANVSVGERLAELFASASREGRYGPDHAGLARVAHIPPSRDIRAEARRIVPYLHMFSAFVAPSGTTRGEVVRGLVPLVSRLGGHVIDPSLGAPSIDTVRLASALADVLVTWDGDRRVIEPRFVLVGDDPPAHPSGVVRGNVVVLDPLGGTGEPGFGATVVWLSGVRVGHVLGCATLP